MPKSTKICIVIIATMLIGAGIGSYFLYDYAYSWGHFDGHQDACDSNYEDGYNKGYSKGRIEGYNEGYNEAKVIAEDLFNNLPKDGAQIPPSTDSAPTAVSYTHLLRVEDLKTIWITIRKPYAKHKERHVITIPKMKM